MSRTPMHRAARSISIIVSPPPATMAERRSILRALEIRGSVEFFKAVPNHESAFVSLMREQRDAAQLVHDSPYKFVVALPNRDQNRNQNQKRSLPEEPTRTKEIGAVKEPAPAITSFVSLPQMTPLVQSVVQNEMPEKEFKIYVAPMPDYKHQSSSSSALNRSWPSFFDDSNTFVTAVLRQTVPGTMAGRGLAHWQPDLGRKWTPSFAETKKKERFQLFGWIPSKMQQPEDRAKRFEEARERPWAKLWSNAETDGARKDDVSGNGNVEENAKVDVQEEIEDTSVTQASTLEPMRP